MIRRTEGNETWKSLRDWVRGDAAAERLAGVLLLHEGFQSVDPTHPLGGPDGLKDLVSTKEGKKWIGAVYFPRGQQTFSKIRKKFNGDIVGVEDNDAEAFVFVTNQELKLSERERLAENSSVPTEIYHLERISLLLNSPPLYGVRLEFLDIEMSKEEQLAFLASRDKVIEELQVGVARIESHVDKTGPPKVVDPQFEPAIGRMFVGRELRNCSHCGYGFYVSTLHKLLGLSSLCGRAIFRCPDCGHIEEESE